MIRVARLIVVLGGLGLASPAQAQQAFYTQDEPFRITPASPSTPGPVVVASPAATRAERRAARRQGRYQTMRPTYASGPGLTFAPFSDRYYPRTIYYRDQQAAVRVNPSTTLIAPR